MKSKKAKEIIDNSLSVNKYGHFVTGLAAINAVEAAEQELCDKFAEDIHRLVETWDRSDKKLDAIYSDEVEKLQAEINRLRTAQSESEDRKLYAELTRWHNPEEEMPPEDKDVLMKVYDPLSHTFYAVGRFHGSEWDSDSGTYLVLSAPGSEVIGWREIYE